MDLMSLPFNQSIHKKAIIIKYNGTDYTWQEAVNNIIILDFIYGWNATNQNYDTIDNLEPGNGYWMYSYDECELWDKSATSITNDDYITNLLAEWNIVGLPDEKSIDKENITVFFEGTDYTWQQAVDNGTILDFIYGWNATNQNYETTGVLLSGKSYWMYAYEDCTLKRII